MSSEDKVGINYGLDWSKVDPCYPRPLSPFSEIGLDQLVCNNVCTRSSEDEVGRNYGVDWSKIGPLPLSAPSVKLVLFI